MTWIESHQSLRMHPKTRRLARLLGVGVPDAIGRLHLLWWWALDYAPNGDLSSYVFEDIAEAMMWEDGADHLIQSLITAGFLDIAPVLSVHHWPDYTGRLLDQREANAARQRKWRELHKLQKAETVTSSNVSEPALLRNAHVTVSNVSRTGATGPNLPDLTGPNLPDKGAQALREQAQIASADAPPNGGIEKKSPRRNEIWDALVAAGLPSPRTKAEQKTWGTAVAQLKDAGETAETITAVVGEYRRAWPTMTCTPMALANHLSEFKPHTNGSVDPSQVLVDRQVDAMQEALCALYYHGHTPTAEQAREARTTAEALVQSGLPPSDVKRLREKVRETLPDGSFVHMASLRKYAHVAYEPERPPPGIPLPPPPEPHGPEPSKELVEELLGNMARKVGINR